MQSIKPYLLYFPALPDEAFEIHILPSLTHSSLLSIVNICDDGFTYVFKSQEVAINSTEKYSSKDQETEEMDYGKSHSLYI